MIDDYVQKFATHKFSSNEEVDDAFFRQCYGQSNFHELELQRLGYVTKTIVPDLANAYSVLRVKNGGLVRGVVDRIKEFRPEVVYIENIFQFSSAELQQMRAEVPSIRLLIGFLSSAFNRNTVELLRSYNFIITCCPGFQQEFREAGLNAILLMHAFSPCVPGELRKAEWPRKTELSFIGGLIAGEKFHNARIEMLEHLVKSGIDLQVFGSVETGTAHLAPVIRPLQLLAWLWQSKFVSDLCEMPMILKRARNWVPRENLRISSALRARISPPVYGLRMYQALADSLITLNSTIRSSKYIANMRLFEATGAGACVLTDRKENLPELFEEGVEILSYDSYEECADKVLWLKKNPETAREIGLRGQQRCLRDHIYAKRTPILDRAIRELL
jgi:hypothetical protein